VPAEGQKEIGRLTVRTGDTVSLSAFVTGKHVSDWISSNPASIRVDKRGELQGIRVDSGFVSINDDEYISVAVVPREDFYTVQDREISFLPPGSRTGSDSTMDIGEYRTEPTFRLAYRFNNRGETRGASGSNGGIDILARGDNYRWLWTTYGQGGWYYDLNGVRREMVNGRQSSPNGVELRVDPEFVYDQGVPYLQLRHSLQNHGNSPAKGQRFGASADVMMHANDHAPLIRTRYGAYMADAFEKPGLELMFIGEGFGGINPVDTLWLGEWGGGSHLFHIYDDRREDLYGEDSAIGFSFQNIDLAPGETREFVVRFTLARNDFQE
jgi:hypothetical protein